MDKLSIKPGDHVVHIIGPREEELVVTIEHQTHGIKGNDKDYCLINGYYWAYDDIMEIIHK